MLKQQLISIQQRIEQQLEQKLTALNIADEHLAKAMQYGLLSGGKRLRPFLLYATAEALGADVEQADSAAVAIEMIHSYSLVHDDLPAMDDDDYRRGKPTCHKVYGDANAILAGDGLLTAAFEVLANAEEYTAQQRLQLIQILAQASGGAGMVAGQSTDLNHVNKSMTLAELEAMHRNKTGALIRAAVLMGAVCASSTAAAPMSAVQQQALIAYADAIGLAYQIWDDILDVEGEASVLGKSQGKDQANNKPTYPALLGLDGARKKALELVESAQQALKELSTTSAALEDFANYIIQRNHWLRIAFWTWKLR